MKRGGQRHAYLTPRSCYDTQAVSQESKYHRLSPSSTQHTLLESQEITQAIEELIPYIRNTVIAYYVLEGGDGTFVSIAICKDEAKVEAANRVKAEWLKHYLAATIVDQESVTEISLTVDDPIQGTLHVGISEPESGDAENNSP